MPPKRRVKRGGGGGSGGSGNAMANIRIAENIKVSILKAMQRLKEDPDMTEYSFPTSLTSEERKYIHKIAPKEGFKTKSQGKGDERFITAYKSTGFSLVKNEAQLNLDSKSKAIIAAYQDRFGFKEQERADVTLLHSIAVNTGRNQGTDMAVNFTKLGSVAPQVPPALIIKEQNRRLLETRNSLPIATQRQEIMQCISENSVILISGDTGCGKTTQVPQFILEQSTQTGRPVRIVTAEPRRLAALSVAERVSQERGEPLGFIVGYQIRLESRTSPRTLLTFCTNGILLRSLMNADTAALLNSITHIIIDEVHERDSYSDMLLTVLRDALVTYRHLKLIMMSATFDMKRLQTYFGGCPIVMVESRPYHVESLFLDDILLLLEYNFKEFSKVRKKESRKKRDESLLIDLSSPTESKLSTPGSSVQSPRTIEFSANEDSTADELEAGKTEYEERLKAAWTVGDAESFEQLLATIINYDANVNYPHQETAVTPLIAATAKNQAQFVEMFLNLGADLSYALPQNGWTAVEYAKEIGDEKIVELLASRMAQMVTFTNEPVVNEEEEDIKKQLLEFYHNGFNDEESVDYQLIMAIIIYIFKTFTEKPKGAILVFLPGYEEIVTMYDNIVCEKQLNPNEYKIYMLHSKMQSGAQKDVFKSVQPHMRKIILATNIAETSVTIDDVVYVIDGGKMKEKSFDSILGCTMLKSVWVSQANALQRRGRAGRCRNGFCFHLFSKYRFLNMAKFQLPEILRIPIHELCLQLKLLSPNGSIASFLAKTPDSPSNMSIQNALTILKSIGALTEDEKLTKLGLQLLDLPIDPCLGKMLLYGIILRCLDPVLTIVSMLAYRDPFLIPSDPAKRATLASIKRKLANDSFSDHLVLLRAFQEWQKACSERFERSFCNKNYISSSAMEMIYGLRAQLLGQLRASGYVRPRGKGDIGEANLNSDKWAVVKAALFAGSYPRVIRLDKKSSRLMTPREPRVRIHQSSVLGPQRRDVPMAKWIKEVPSEWATYEEMMRNGHMSYAEKCTLVSPITAALFGGSGHCMTEVTEIRKDEADGEDESSSEQEVDEDDDWAEDQDPWAVQKALLQIDDWLRFEVALQDGRLLAYLRNKWLAMFNRRMNAGPRALPSQEEEQLINTIGNVLCCEEMRLRLPHLAGIGQRPRAMYQRGNN